MGETGRTAGSGERAAAPVFIVGAPRSGTTLLSTMMDSHSQVAIAPEMHYFSKYWSRFTRALEPGGEGAEAIVDFFLTTPEILDMHLTPVEEEQIRAQLRGRPDVGHREIYTAFVRAYADRSAKPVYGEKTPAYLLKIPTLAALFPSSRFISITRDPRDVSLSWRKAHFAGGPGYHALMWRKFYRASRDSSAALGDDRFLSIRYEDLLSDPRGVLTSCCDLLGVDFEEGMTSFHTAAAPNFDASREWWKAKAMTPLDPTNKDKWRSGLTKEHVAILELVLRREMAQSSYVRAGVPISPSLTAGIGKSIARDVIRTYPTVRKRRLADRDARLSSSDAAAG